MQTVPGKGEYVARNAARITLPTEATMVTGRAQIMYLASLVVFLTIVPSSAQTKVRIPFIA